MCRFRFYLFLLIIFLLVSVVNAQEKFSSEALNKKALSIRFKDPDSAAYYFNKGYEMNLQNKDTVNAVNFLLELSLLYGHNVNYSKSYDGYWQALLLAEKAKDFDLEAKIYQGLGWLYSFYDREGEALKYFNRSVTIRKEHHDDHNYTNLAFLQSDYFSILNLYRVNKNYKMAEKYLDSCTQIQARIFDATKSYYLLAEQGFLQAVNGDFTSSLKNLNDCKVHFEGYDPSYLVIVYTLIGNVYALKGDFAKSVATYKKALAISVELKRHLNYRIVIYEALSDLHFKQNKYKEAYEYLRLAKERNDAVFGSKSENNRKLLEIKDNYRLEKQKQKQLIDEQHIAELEYEEKVSRLQSVILIGSLIFILLYGFVWAKHIRNKHKNEKRVLEEKQKLRIKKQSEILELKNKELTESALRLIEKDEFISSIKNKLANQGDNVDVNVLKRMLKSIQGTPSGNWKEFEARFTAINQSFYDNLNEKFPNLSQTDQKICALVKLNFPSKDMSKLLGISVESVHTSRYRLRKKLNLDRNDNLEEFINQR